MTIKFPEDKKDAVSLLASLLIERSGPVVKERLYEQARASKQSVSEVARRAASNLLTSFTTDRPFGSF